MTELELVGGAEALTVGLREHDETWARTFREHGERILRALAGREITVEHIGSTAVAGLVAKPIIDILVVVDDITAEEDYLGPLLDSGYELRVREPGHRLVRTPERDVHVHVYERGARAIEDYLLLRDRLRSDPADRALYENTKRSLMTRSWDDMNDYAEAKTRVVTAVVERARSSRGS